MMFNNSAALNLFQRIKDRTVADCFDLEAQFLTKLMQKAESDAGRPNLNDYTRGYFAGLAQGYRLSAENLTTDAERIRNR